MLFKKIEAVGNGNVTNIALATEKKPNAVKIMYPTQKIWHWIRPKNANCVPDTALATSKLSVPQQKYNDGAAENKIQTVPLRNDANTGDWKDWQLQKLKENL
jgi:hypothetical protein